MIKGHMTIELADGKTGKVVERHEDDNLVTNGIKHYFKNMGMFNSTPFYQYTGQIMNNNPQNLAIPLFGGLLLFDTAQEETAEHIFVSGGTKMTGNGINGYTSNDSVTEFGSYNSEESGWQSDGSFKQVWDFTTTQANGTIACACLVPRNYGAHGEGNGTSKVVKTALTGMTDIAWYQYAGLNQAKQLLSRADQFFGAGFEAYPIYINAEDNYAIILGYKVGYYSGSQQFKAVKVAFPWGKFDIRDGYQNGGRVLGNVQDIALPSQLDASRAWINRPYALLGRDSDGAFYIAVNTAGYSSYNFNATYPTHIVKFVVGANDTVTCEYVMSLTPSLIGETVGDFYYSSPNTLAVVGNSLFLATNTAYNTISRERWYKINLSTQVVESVEDDTVSSFTAFAVRSNAIVINDSNSIYYHNSINQVVKVDLTSKTVTSLNSYEAAQGGSYYGFVDDRCALLYNQGYGGNEVITGTVFRWLHFLSTINNLESPVIKTPDKTMKVTYVLRFDEQ